jgi:hypothetical protein
MRLGWVVGLVGISVGVAMARPAAVWAIYQQICPSDPAQRRALAECFLEDNRFDRLDPVAREACYRHNSVALGPAAGAADSAPGWRASSENFVDRWRAAGEGHMSQNDIRAVQHSER